MPNSHCAVAVVAIVIGFVLPKEERRAKWRDRIVGKWSTKFPGDVIWIRCVGVFRPQLWIGIDESNWKGVLTDSDRDMHESESCRACMHVRCVSRIASCEHGGGLEGSYSWQGALIWVWYGNGKVGRLVGCLGLNLDLRARGDWYGICGYVVMRRRRGYGDSVVVPCDRFDVDIDVNSRFVGLEFGLYCREDWNWCLDQFGSSLLLDVAE